MTKTRSPRLSLSVLTVDQRRAVMEAVGWAYIYGTPVLDCQKTLPHPLSTQEIRKLYHECMRLEGNVVPCRCGKELIHRGACVKKPGEGQQRFCRVKPLSPNDKQATCPCCGKEFHAETLAVDLTTNTVGYKNKAWRVTPQLTSFIFKLVDAYPNHVESYDLRVAVWGAIDGPDKADTGVKVLASQFRKLLAQTDLKLELGPRPASYVLKKKENGHDSVPADHRPQGE